MLFVGLFSIAVVVQWEHCHGRCSGGRRTGGDGRAWAMDQSILREMCRRAGVTGALTASPMTGGYSNENYLIQSTAGSSVLRIHRDPAAARRERLIHELVAATVPVAPFLYIEEDAAVLGHAFALQGFIAGPSLASLVALDDATATDAGAAAGGVLAAIAAHTFSASGFFDGDLRPTG